MYLVWTHRVIDPLPPVWSHWCWSFKMQPICNWWTHVGHSGSKHSECAQFLITGYIVINCCLSPQCTHHVPTGYMGPCPQCHRSWYYWGVPDRLWGFYLLSYLLIVRLRKRTTDQPGCLLWRDSCWRSNNRWELLVEQCVSTSPVQWLSVGKHDRGGEQLWQMDRGHVNDPVLINLLYLSILGWSGPNNHLHQVTQAIWHSTILHLHNFSSRLDFGE